MAEEELKLEINEPEEPEVEIKEYNEEEVFDKKSKKKRQLTEKQQQALAEGRAKIKAKRLAKQEEIIKKKLETEMKEQNKAKKQESKLIEKAEEEVKEQKRVKKAKLTAQQRAKQRILEKQEKKKIEEDKLVYEYDELKYKCLENCNTEEEFDTVDNVLTKYITRKDILKGKDHLRDKVGEIVKLIKKE